MIKNTFRFWFTAILVLTTVYFISNPVMAKKVGTGVYELWQAVVSTVVKAPTLLATIKQTQQDESTKPEQTVSPFLESPNKVVRPILENPKQETVDPTENTAHQRDENLSRDGRRYEELFQKSQDHQSSVPEVKMEDVLLPPAVKSQPQASDGPEVAEKAISLEVLKEIYAKHLEALKILDTEAVDEQNEK
jgi:hypothetical protein